MKVIIKFLQTTVLVSILLLVFCWHFVGTFRSNQQLTAVLDDAEFYTVAAKVIAGQINSQLVGDEKSVSAAKQAIDQSVSSQIARTTLQPIQIAVIDWLASEKESFSLELDLSAIKSKTTSATSNQELKFLLTKLLPDKLSLGSEEKISEQDAKSLRQVKSFYQFSERAIPVLVFIIAASAVLLLVVNLRRGSKKFTAILMPLAMASIIGLIMVGISYPLQDMVQISNTQSQTELGVNISFRLLLAVIQITMWSWVVIGLFSISGIIVSRTLFRSKDKKLKEKKKK